MVDTHCHLNIIIRNFSNEENFSPLTSEELLQCQDLIKAAQKNAVTKIINVGTNLPESKLCLQISQNFSSCYTTLGLHPNDADANWQTTIHSFNEILRQRTPNDRIIGIGECGIDQHYPNFNLKLQEAVFHAQIQMALQHNLALVIHSRDADSQTFNVLAQYRGEKNFRGSIHCFSSDEKYAQKYLDLGFVLGFGGTLTYPKNETLRQVAKTIPLEKIILETDAPFLSPQQVRGTKNVPANIKLIAEFLANLRNVTFQTVAQSTFETTCRLFCLED